MHSSNMAICLMDSDKATGTLYLDADDFLHGFLCHSQNCLSGRGAESPLLFLLTDSQSLWLSDCIWDWLTALSLSTTLPHTTFGSHCFPSLWKLSINAAAKKERTNHLSAGLLHVHGDIEQQYCHGCRDEKEKNRSETVSLHPALYHSKAWLSFLNTAWWNSEIKQCF